MKRILVTGATGNIGSALIRALEPQRDIELIAASRNPEKEEKSGHHTWRLFDFKNPATFDKALEGVDTLFLLRPPQISDVKVFETLIKSTSRNKEMKIVFLSVQGADRSSIIPHYKIEKLIEASDHEYIFVRPSYFMQNLTTTLYSEIKRDRRISLPSGLAKFNWIDVLDIANVTAQLIGEFEKWKNEAYTITGSENLNFKEVVDIINSVTDANLVYRRVNPIRYYFLKKKEGVSKGMRWVMLILHFLPRLQKEPEITSDYKRITTQEPTSVKAFVKRERQLFETSK